MSSNTKSQSMQKTSYLPTFKHGKTVKMTFNKLMDFINSAYTTLEIDMLAELLELVELSPQERKQAETAFNKVIRNYLY